MHILLEGFNVGTVPDRVHRGENLAGNSGAIRIYMHLVIFKDVKFVALIGVLYNFEGETEAWSRVTNAIIWVFKVEVEKFAMFKFDKGEVVVYVRRFQVLVSQY